MRYLLGKRISRGGCRDGRFRHERDRNGGRAVRDPGDSRFPGEARSSGERRCEVVAVTLEAFGEELLRRELATRHGGGGHESESDDGRARPEPRSRGIRSVKVNRLPLGEARRESARTPR